MRIFLFFLSVSILFFYPVLYPPIACFTAIFWSQKKSENYISLFLIFSAAIISSLIVATITPTSDTLAYVESFKSAVDSFDISEIGSARFEPMYHIYEYLLAICIGDNEKLFLLITALIFNLLSTVAILKICHRLNQFKLVYIIFCVYHSLVYPSLGIPLFLLRTSLSSCILFFGISFYKQKKVLYHFLAFISILIHYSSLITYILFTFRIPFFFQQKSKEILRILLPRIIIFAFILLILFVILAPKLLNSILFNFIYFFQSINIISSNKAAFFANIYAQGEDQVFFKIYDPALVSQFILSFLCFFRLRKESLIGMIGKNNEIVKNINYDFLERLRQVSRWQIILVVITFRFSILPLRLGIFNFLYFPLWLVNIPFLDNISHYFKRYSRYLIVFALISLLYFSLFKIPRIQSTDYRDSAVAATLVVLEGKPLNYNLVKLCEYLF